MAPHSKSGWDHESSPRKPPAERGLEWPTQHLLSAGNRHSTEQLAFRHSRPRLLPRPGSKKPTYLPDSSVLGSVWGRQEVAQLTRGRPFRVAGPVLEVRESRKHQVWPSVRTFDSHLSVMEEPQIPGRKYFLSEPQKWIEYLLFISQMEVMDPHLIIKHLKRCRETILILLALVRRAGLSVAGNAKGAFAILGLMSLSVERTFQVHPMSLNKPHGKQCVL